MDFGGLSKTITMWKVACLLCLSFLAACSNEVFNPGGSDTVSFEPVEPDNTGVSIDREDLLASPSGGDKSVVDTRMDWDPKPDDVGLVEQEAFVERSEILVMESYPPQFALSVSGSLPTPCHQLRVAIDEPDQENRIQIRIYSVVDPGEVCVQVLESFDENIPLGTPPPDYYKVFINGEEIGEIGYE